MAEKGLHGQMRSRNLKRSQSSLDGLTFFGEDHCWRTGLHKTTYMYFELNR